MIWYLGSDPVQKTQECAVPLGIQGESDVLTYTADVSDWLVLWPDGVVALVLQAPDRSEPYMANTAIDRENGIVTWTVTGYDTALAGYGAGELRLIEGDVIKKSYKFATYTKASVLACSADPPPPVPDWLSELMEIASDIQGVVDDAEAAAESASASALAASQSATAAQQSSTAATSAKDTAIEAMMIARDYRDEAQEYAQASAASADRAEQAATTAGYMAFHIDDSGHLVYQRTDNVDIDFELEDGRLIAIWQ